MRDYGLLPIYLALDRLMATISLLLSMQVLRHLSPLMRISSLPGACLASDRLDRRVEEIIVYTCLP